MNIRWVIVLVLLANVILTLIVFFGYRLIMNSKPSIKNTEDSDLDNKNKSISLDLKVLEAPYTHHGVKVKVSTLKLETGPAYTKYTFTTEQRPSVNTLYLEYYPIELENNIFESCILYKWFDAPLLAIVNTVKKENDIEVPKSLYFKSTGDTYDRFTPYTIKEDIQNNPSEVLKLLNKINLELFNMITIDIANDLTAKNIDPVYLNEKKTLNISKETFVISPFVKILTKINVGGFSNAFQIYELKNKDEILKIDLPPYKIHTFSVFKWNQRPILLLLKTELRDFYFTLNDKNEWIRYVNDGMEMKSYITERELHEELEKINFRLNKAIFVDVSMMENYSYMGTDIIVVKEGIFLENNKKYYLYTHKVKNDETFLLGACMQNSLFLKDIPIAIEIYSLSIYKNIRMPYLMKIVISENGTKKDKIYRLEKDSRWRAVNKINLKEDIKSRLDEISESLGPTIELDVGQKHNYQCLNDDTSSMCDHVSVKFYAKHDPYTIYSHRPIFSDNKLNLKHSTFSFNRVLYNGQELRGIVPGIISRARVYMLDDEIPVGIEIFTDNSTVNYINKGDNYWKTHKGYTYGSKFMLSPHQFINHSKERNMVVSVDLGSKTYSSNKDGDLTSTNQKVGDYVRYSFSSPSYPVFKFKGIFFKGFEYDFDSDALFMESFSIVNIYYHSFSKIPLAFELVSDEDKLLYFNNLDGKWLKIANVSGDVTPVLHLVWGLTMGKFVIDNFEGYSCNRGPVSVVEDQVSDGFVKYTHKLADLQEMNGIIYKAYAITGLPRIFHTDSMSVYFKKDSYLALLIQININSTTKSYANRGNDHWASVDVPRDIPSFLLKLANDLEQD